MTEGAGVVAATVIADAIKASGAILSVGPGDFEAILKRVKSPLVVRAKGGVLSTKYHYLTSYRGLIFYTKTQTPLLLSRTAELIAARKIWIPS